MIQTFKLRRGATVVETAVVGPLVVLVLLGMMEAGYAFMIRQTVTSASREGARVAVVKDATMTDVNSKVDAVMTAAGLSGYTTTSNLTGISATATEVWVQVSIPLNRALFTGRLLGGNTFTIQSKTVMHREGLTS